MKLKIKNLFKVWAESRAKKQQEEDIAQVCRDVQLREFESKIYLCYNNIPLIEQGQLKDTLCNTIQVSRNTVCRYLKLID